MMPSLVERVRIQSTLPELIPSTSLIHVLETAYSRGLCGEALCSRVYTMSTPYWQLLHIDLLLVTL